MKTLCPVLLLGVLGAFVPARAQTGPDDNVGPMSTLTLQIDKATMNAQVAATSAQEERGLMFRPQMPDNDGMIFILPIGYATFWMKNTLIPLSIAFVDKNSVILEIHDMKAMDETVTRSDSNQVAFAIEANLHWFSLNGIKPGDKIRPALASLRKASDD